MSSNTAAVALAESCANLYATVGMHPHDAKDVGEEELQKLKTHRLPEVIAVGETGLDYYYNHSPREVQRRGFRAVHPLGGETGLPLVVHERDAASEAVELLRSEGAEKSAVIHCFTASRCSELPRFGVLSLLYWYYFQERPQDVVRRVPLDRMFVETDSPYLTPVLYEEAQRAGLRKVSR